MDLFEFAKPLLHFDEKDLILNNPNLWLDPQRVFLDKPINKAKFLIDFITEVVVAIQDKGSVDGMDAVDFGQQELKYLYLMFGQVFLIVEPIAQIHDFELSQIS